MYTFRYTFLYRIRPLSFWNLSTPFTDRVVVPQQGFFLSVVADAIVLDHIFFGEDHRLILVPLPKASEIDAEREVHGRNTGTFPKRGRLKLRPQLPLLVLHYASIATETGSPGPVFISPTEPTSLSVFSNMGLSVKLMMLFWIISLRS